MQGSPVQARQVDFAGHGGIGASRVNAALFGTTLAPTATEFDDAARPTVLFLIVRRALGRKTPVRLAAVAVEVHVAQHPA